MKLKVSVSLDERTVKDIDANLNSGLYRNRSHFVEYAVKKILGEKG